MTHRPDISRRDFIKTITAFVGTLIATGIGLPSILYLLSPSLEKTEDDTIVDLGPLENYPIGIPTRFEFTRTRVHGWERTATNYGLYVVRKSEGEVRVFSDICTHLGCRVTWHPDQEHYISPCHDGHFDIVGTVVGGPPPRPLDEFIVEVKNDNLMVFLPPVKRTG
ncbi:MAG TPA: ubiquinol-cytochrome c reductase iron-sulfur subunit [Anaerolineales bacterium]|nr:ubiquinol-cytochrome c reductase iron-sulfur subunit [Anaerolineales bacterium]